MSNTRRTFIQQSILVAGTAAFVSKAGAAETGHSSIAAEENTMATQASTSSQQVPPGTTNVLGGNHFDPAKWLIVPAKTFDDLKVGDVFRVPSRTLTAAHTSQFQAVSIDSHPRHYNAEYAKAHGMPTMLVQPFQLLSLTAPGASLFTHYVGESIAGLKGVSCDFGKDTYVGDTMYPALEIAELKKEDDFGHVLMAIVIYNQKGEVVLSGHQRFELKLS